VNLNEAYPSRYITADDLNGQDVTVTISAVNLEEIGQGRDKERKLVISLAGKQKQFVCNKTNATTISKVLGSTETEDWVGKRITIGPREVEFQGSMVWALRVSLKAPAAAGVKPAATRPAPRPEPGPVQGQEGRLPDEDTSVPF